ncbi:MAG: ATP-binding protein [Tepidisphaeraceae bacterium]|jgi:signal transduction histidine kinase/CheY-like chemotaxis protein
MPKQAKELSDLAQRLRTWAAKWKQSGGEPDAAVLADMESAAGQMEEAAQRILRNSEELARANGTSDRFIANISHELRTPLTPALLIVSSLQMDTSLPDNVRGDLSMVREQLDLEARLVDDLLDNSRLNRGKMQLRLEPIDLRALLGGLVAGRQAQETGGARLSLDYQAKQRRVQGDPARLRQIFSKLLQNAFKFTPAEGSVNVIATDDGKSIAVEVRDSGKGFDPARAAELFQAFDHGQEALVRNFDGLGLGLSIARGLAQLHGGELSASSPGLGQGATFRVVLPAIADAPIPERAVRPRVRVLLVEDDGQSRVATGRLLELMGYIVRTAGTYAAALALLKSEQIDVLLCDIDLPDGDGWTLMGEARKISDTINGLALSGYGAEEHIQKSLDSGYFGHLVKPITMQSLTAAINRAARAGD